ncbi:MAG: hypothetical protein A2V64_02440 [Bacteroidetes bacterium RBG_13_43_22]|nr:MAG: hypothetical protein A2V64_02440 [Bacteroidetes bacterium RBG_13_43_22]
MKKIKQVIVLFAALLLIGGCDKDFVEINTDPFAISEIDLGLLFAGSQGADMGGWESEHTIVQHFVNPFNDGATLAFNFNYNIDGFQNTAWGEYSGSIKAFVHILHLLEGTTDKINLQSMVRISKAGLFMDMVDHYGDVPYFNAGLAAIEGEESFYPVYDDDEAIYDDLYNELHEAIANLDPDGDFVSADLVYGAHAYYPTSTAAAQVEKWKKYGNSLMLRLGMRYSKSDAAKAASIVSEAFNGGVMTSNTDNAFVVYDGTLYTNGANGGLVNNQPKFYYAAEPFVDHLKATNDPRSKYMIAMYNDPGNPLGTLVPDVDLADQYGVPVGIVRTLLPNAPYRGVKGQGFDYSQMNVNIMASQRAPTFALTYAQTSLLLAEAAKRGWIAGGDVAAQQYYENAIRADMNIMSLYLSQTGSSLPPVSVAEQDAYIAQANVAYNAANALDLINTQYWVVCIRNGSEAWANFRRSGLPALNRNAYDNQLLENGGNGYVHRFSYPDAELSQNKANYQAAVAALVGGKDDLVNRVFWDTP